jgi:hypothetical protein
VSCILVVKLSRFTLQNYDVPFMQAERLWWSTQHAEAIVNNGIDLDPDFCIITILYVVLVHSCDFERWPQSLSEGLFFSSCFQDFTTHCMPCPCMYISYDRSIIGSSDGIFPRSFRVSGPRHTSLSIVSFDGTCPELAAIVVGTHDEHRFSSKYEPETPTATNYSVRAA